MRVNVEEAETQFSRLIELVEHGETVTLTRDGRPVAEMTQVRTVGFPFGIARHHPIAPPGDEWWQPMTDDEAEDWLEGR